MKTNDEMMDEIEKGIAETKKSIKETGWPPQADIDVMAKYGFAWHPDTQGWKRTAAVELGRLGGQAKSEAKTRAARKNAKKPRPRK
jgi:hypothetical protein